MSAETRGHHGAIARAYRPAGRYDELVDERGHVRAPWAQAWDVVGADDDAELARRRTEAERLLAAAGATHAADDRRTAWRIDPLPYVIDGRDWDRLADGLAQRARLLEAYLADLHGPQRVLADGVVPVELALGPHGLPLATLGVPAPGGRHLVRHGAAVVRGDDGRFVVLRDRTDDPDGAAVALLHRTTLARLVPGAIRRLAVRRQVAWFDALRDALARLAPAGVDSPRVVVLGPPRAEPGGFEPSYLAAQLGYHLADRDDLVVRGGRVWLRSIEGPEPVDVVLRCVGDAEADPLELGSRHGVPGLLVAARAGAVGLANPLGASAAQDVALCAYLPALCRALLGEELRLPSATTWWCGDPTQRDEVGDRLGELVVHERGDADASATVLAWRLDDDALVALRRRIAADPGRFVAQERLVTASTPVHGAGGLEAGHVIVRTLAVASGTDGWEVLPGGVARVVDPARPMLAQRDAVAKDVWVVGGAPGLTHPSRRRSSPQVDLRQSLPARAAEALYWVGRNAERAEACARLGLVVAGRLEAEPELADADGGAWAWAVAAALRAVSGGTAPAPDDDPVATLRSAVTGRAGTLDDSLAHLARTAAAVREYLPSATWRVLATLTAERAAAVALTTGGAAGPGSTGAGPMAPGALAEVLERIALGLAALAGLSQESTVRGPAWRFLDLGRRVQRALDALNAAEAALVDPLPVGATALVLETLLQAWESLVAYRRVHRSDVEPDAALDLLLLDTANPRAVAFDVDRLVEHLAALPHPVDATPPVRAVRAAADALLAADGVALARRGPSGRRDALAAFVLEVRGAVLDAAGGVTRTWFDAGAPAPRRRREQW